MPSKPIATIILAAGESRRMGCPKQLLHFRDTTLIQHAIESAISANLGPAFLVLGANAKVISAQINEDDVKLVLNENWDAGMHTSIRRGIEALEIQQPDSAAAILMNCDQPYITGETLRALATTFHASARSAVASHYGGTNGTPALFSAALFNKLKALNSGGAKHLLKELGHEVIYSDFPSGEVDIDTHADYIQLTAVSAVSSASVVSESSCWNARRQS